VFDCHRLKPVLRLSGFLLLFLLAINIVLALFSAAFPAWLPHQFFGLDFVADNRQRAVAAAAQYRDGVVDRDDPLVLILGLSSASESIRLETLRREVDQGTRYLVLSGAGRNMGEVTRYAGPLLESDVRPDLVVFAINPFHLMDPPPFKEGFVNNLRQSKAIAELLGFWLYLRRADVKHAVEVRVLDARYRVFDAFDVRMDESGPDPWREIVRMGLTQTSTEAGWHAKIRQYGLRGYYDPQAYIRSRHQAAALIELITQFEARDSNIMIVLMPEHSSLRQRIPAEAMGALLEPLHQAFDEQLPTLTNLRDAIPDSDFADISHLNEDGRTRLSPLLAEAIRQNLPTPTN